MAPGCALTKHPGVISRSQGGRQGGELFLDPSDEQAGKMDIDKSVRTWAQAGLLAETNSGTSPMPG